MQIQQAAPKLFTLIIAAIPIMMLSQIGHASAGFFGLMFLGSYVCLTQFEASKAILYFSHYRNLLLALFASTAVVLISGIHHHQISGSDLERSLRLAAGVALVLAACLRIRAELLRHAVWGIAISVWVALGYVLWVFWSNPHERPDLSFIHNAVTFGDLMLLATVITAYAMVWNLTRFKKVEIFFKALTVLAGIAGVTMTQTRGAWLAAPFFILIGAILIYRRVSWKKLAISFGLTLVLMAGVLVVNPVMRERVVMAHDEATECMSSNPLAVNSVCIRLQLWQAALVNLRENLWLGSGSSATFPDTLKALAEQKKVSTYVASEFGEPHSDVMQRVSAYGLLGFVTLMLVYLGPGYLFIRRLRSSDSQAERTAAAMGIALCTGFFIFGLTELMFRNMHVVSYYAALNGWLLALSDPNHTRFCKPLSSAEHNFSK